MKIQNRLDPGEARLFANELRCEPGNSDPQVQLRLLTALPYTFVEIIDFFRVDIFNMTRDQLSFKMHIPTKRLDWLREKERNYTIEDIAALIIALQLPPWISLRILWRGGIMLKYTYKDMVYRNILYHLYRSPFEQVQMYLCSKGLPALSDFNKK